ncbi:hypothetical protein JKP88DRAFT_254598 [Tribonema minus]|uniref:Uncharacterized protein n=1 Tax=Tribonema minus TaxID=303371 RepID=A0A835Z2E8_9STRA|nr:hypothetical protein JKP88DRAFT_254598 [Tribonema minus]
MAAHPADQLDTLLKAAAKKNRGNGLNPATACRDALTDHPWLEFNAVKTGPQHFTAADAYYVSHLLTLALTVVAQNHMPKGAWSLCKLMHQKPPRPSSARPLSTLSCADHSTWIHCRHWLGALPHAAADTADNFNAFRDVTVITLRYYAGACTHIPHTLQALRIVECDLTATIPMLRAVVRAQHSTNLHTNALTLVKSVSCGAGTEWLPGCIADLAALTELTLRECSELVQLPHSIGDLAALMRLEIRDCSNLQYLPHSISNLAALKDLCCLAVSKFQVCPLQSAI